ncbi:stress-response A/B barrel domain-containing protein HS1-like [Euphorbia lathyris]|uniref:stress-response A/B barrel domain-containing protein HS1-like n=1 Tax=Euphorbia lathyris TaxID=212925 RepID=UPI0033141E37
MGEAKGEYHHLVLAKFKDEITIDQIDELIKGYANLVNLIPSMKTFHWATNISKENVNGGFTHIFDSTFESAEGIEEYVQHPAHIEFAALFATAIDQTLVVAYKPTLVNL